MFCIRYAPSRLQYWILNCIPLKLIVWGVCLCVCVCCLNHIQMYVKLIRRSHLYMYRFEFYVSFCWNLHVHCHRFECHVPKSTVLHMLILFTEKSLPFSLRNDLIFLHAATWVVTLFSSFHTRPHIYDFYSISWYFTNKWNHTIFHVFYHCMYN